MRALLRFGVVPLVIACVAPVAIWNVWRCYTNRRSEYAQSVHCAHRPLMAKVADGEVSDRALLFSGVEGKVMSAPELASEKNQEMDRLLGRRTIPSDYTATMRTLHGDHGQDVLTRNFAIQHLGLHVQEMLRRGTYDPNTSEAAQVRATLEAAAGETASSVAGPAFLALADLAEVDPHVDAVALDAHLAACAGDTAAHVPTRVIAVQLCGTRRIRAARPALQAILADPSAGTVLKLSAHRAMDECAKP